MLEHADEELDLKWFKRIDLKTVVLLLMLVISWVGSYFSLSGRVEDSSRRIATLEQNLVPRAESTVRDAALSGQLQDIKAQLRDVIQRLDRIGDGKP